MSRFAKLASLLLVALWLPATLHCQLESLGFGTLFACPTAGADSSHAAESDCADDSCATLESGQYAFAKSRVAPAALPFLSAGLLIFSLAQLELVPPALEKAGIDRSAPPVEVAPWQFVRRAALPARAPDSLNA